MNNDNQTSVIANAYLKMLQDRFAPAEQAVVEETPVEQPTEEISDEGKTEE